MGKSEKVNFDLQAMLANTVDVDVDLLDRAEDKLTKTRNIIDFGSYLSNATQVAALGALAVETFVLKATPIPEVALNVGSGVVGLSIVAGVFLNGIERGLNRKILEIQTFRRQDYRRLRAQQ